ncbi:MAG: LytTR family transcriptional regulator [SAR324 cluster bacterium]|nr:LytTR family transcriptional regulator [SAR324 cluster bacterium]
MVSTASAPEAFDPEAISHVTIEEHYSRIFIREGQEFREVQVKLSLKEALARLPEVLFIQTHRSHLVNLAHVSRIQRLARSYGLTTSEGRYRLPVSRHRISQVAQPPGVLAALPGRLGGGVRPTPPNGRTATTMTSSRPNCSRNASSVISAGSEA